jgi:hypothetical protein
MQKCAELLSSGKQWTRWMPIQLSVARALQISERGLALFMTTGEAYGLAPMMEARR